MRLWIFVAMIAMTGCISRSQQPSHFKPSEKSSPTKLKIVKISVSGAPFVASPGMEQSLSGPKLQKRDTVILVVEALPTEVQPVTFSFNCPQLDVKQESASAKFEFAVTDVLIQKGFVDIEVRVNSTVDSRGLSGRDPFRIHFDISKP